MNDADIDLATLRDLHPLPDGVVDVEVKLQDLSDLFKVTVNTVTDWHRTGGLPIKEAGGNGRAYVFQLADCWAWYQSKEADKLARHNFIREQILKGQQELFSDVGEMDEAAGLSHAERARYYEARKLWTQLEEFHLNHCKRSEVQELLESLLILIRDGLQSLPNRVENEAGLLPQQIATVIAICDDITNELRRSIASSGMIGEPGSITPVEGGKLSLH